MGLFGGVEGGASCSAAVLLDEAGNILASVTGDTVNHLLVGLDVAFDRIAKLLGEAKTVAGIPDSTPLDTLGLCLSGCEDEDSNRNLEQEFMTKYPQIAKRIVVASDTVGSIKTALPNGGFVLISGTGSNCMLLNPDNSMVRCGGWGHLLGDEGGGYSIAQRGIKMVLNEMENFRKPQYSTATVQKIVLEHFEVQNVFGLLPFFYQGFEKPKVARLCQKYAAAAENGDELCRELFCIAGRELAEHVVAVLPKVDPVLLEDSLPIVCVGSVFKSWKFMKPGFDEVLGPHVKSFTIYTVTVTSAVGAALYGASLGGFQINIDYEKLRSVLDVYCRQ